MNSNCLFFKAFFLICHFLHILAWPDGAPCLRYVMQSMYPSADEHAKGLNRNLPPYIISLDSDCYWDYSQIRVTLRALDRYRFKGFALQTRQNGTEERLGQFERDDNGSWKYQCFSDKAAITHSHSTPKREITFKWRNSQTQYKGDIIFVATVVDNVQNYWYQSVWATLPHCSSTNVNHQLKSAKSPSILDLNNQSRDAVAGSLYVLPPKLIQLPNLDEKLISARFRPDFQVARDVNKAEAEKKTRQSGKKQNGSGSSITSRFVKAVSQSKSSSNERDLMQRERPIHKEMSSTTTEAATTSFRRQIIPPRSTTVPIRRQSTRLASIKPTTTPPLILTRDRNTCQDRLRTCSEWSKYCDESEYMRARCPITCKSPHCT